MKNWQFWTIIAIIILQSIYISFKFKSIEEQEKYIYSTASFNAKDLDTIKWMQDDTLDIVKDCKWIRD